ncbi:MAG: prepilin-type N-terminal cleavage/methylation domain-containing protein [Clostridia bacterium]|nr:prepilin-type N-terminal cleavage/methylation domain-containing protein [Clostridia bacterium]
MKQSERGFTLLELMLVIGIIAVILAFAIPNFRPALDDARLEQAVQQLEADLMYARQLARTEQTASEVVFSSAGYEIKIDNSVIKTQTLASGTQWDPVPSSSLRFGSDGSPGVSDAAIWLKAADGTRAGVTVYGETGRVEVVY